MHTLFRSFAAVLGFALVTPAAYAVEWPVRMQELHRAFLELAPDLASDRRFDDKSRSKEIRAHVEKLASLAASLPAVKPVDEGDATTPILASLFSEHLTRAASELRAGRRAYAHELLNSVPAFCVACHTRSDFGPDFSKLGLEAPAPIEGMSDFENARLLVATRQFQTALQRYEAILHRITPAEAQNGEWKQAAYGAVTISTRVLGDPKRTEDVIDQILSRGFIPASLRDDVQGWKKSVVEWKTESAVPLSKEDELLAKIRALDAHAAEIRRAPKDRAADLLYLRISALSHEFLRRYPKSASTGDVLYLLGASYEVMREWDLWTFHEVIYETCVRRVPGTETARRCLGRLESSLADDYIGRRMPKSLATRVKGLHQIAGNPK